MPSRTGGAGDGQRWCSRRSPRRGRRVLDGRPHGRARDGRVSLVRRPPPMPTGGGGPPGRDGRWPWSQLLLGRAAAWTARSASTAARSSDAINPVQGSITRPGDPREPGLRQPRTGREPTPIQGFVLTLGLVIFWASRRWRRCPIRSRPARRLARAPAPRTRPRPSWLLRVQSPGMRRRRDGAGQLSVEWTFRGYLDFSSCARINPYAIVPWYDAIPQIGAVLFAAGWWSGPARSGVDSGRPTRAARRRARPCWASALLTLVLIVLNRPRVDALIRESVPAHAPFGAESSSRSPGSRRCGPTSCC